MKNFKLMEIVKKRAQELGITSFLYWQEGNYGLTTTLQITPENVLSIVECGKISEDDELKRQIFPYVMSTSCNQLIQRLKSLKDLNSIDLKEMMSTCLETNYHLFETSGIYGLYQGLKEILPQEVMLELEKKYFTSITEENNQDELMDYKLICFDINQGRLLKKIGRFDYNLEVNLTHFFSELNNYNNHFEIEKEINVDYIKLVKNKKRLQISIGNPQNEIKVKEFIKSFLDFFATIAIKIQETRELKDDIKIFIQKYFIENALEIKKEIKIHKI